MRQPSSGCHQDLRSTGLALDAGITNAIKAIQNRIRKWSGSRLRPLEPNSQSNLRSAVSTAAPVLGLKRVSRQTLPVLSRHQLDTACQSNQVPAAWPAAYHTSPAPQGIVWLQSRILFHAVNHDLNACSSDTPLWLKNLDQAVSRSGVRHVVRSSLRGYEIDHYAHRVGQLLQPKRLIEAFLGRLIDGNDNGCLVYPIHDACAHMPGWLIKS